MKVTTWLKKNEIIQLPHLHSFGPVTHIFAQQEVIKCIRADEIKKLRRKRKRMKQLCSYRDNYHLSEHLLHQLRVDCVNIQDTDEIIQLKIYKTHKINLKFHRERVKNTNRFHE